MSMEGDHLEAVRVAKALADPTRFELLRRIAERGEICCSELVTLFPLSQATVSHHLKILAEAGLVSTRREGPKVSKGEKPMKRIVRIVAALVVAAPALALAGTSTWTIDPAHSHSGFAVKHLVISTVRGEFGKTTGSIVLDDQDITKSSVEATIDTTSINTRVADRDNHLKSPDFFDVAKYPTLTFKSTKVEKAGEGKLKVTGDLTLHGVTKPITLDVEGPTGEIKDMMGNTRRGLSATATLNRKDYGLAWSKMIEAGPVVGDEVAIDLEVELLKPKS